MVAYVSLPVYSSKLKNMQITLELNASNMLILLLTVVLILLIFDMEKLIYLVSPKTNIAC